MRNHHPSRPPQSLRQSTVHLDNVALVPASLLPFKRDWQVIADGISQGETLIVLPSQVRQQRIASSVATALRAKGRNVRVISWELK